MARESTMRSWPAEQTITYGGTLNLVNISGAPYAAGNSFQIFHATTYNNNAITISPTIPGPGLAWDTSQLNIGFLNVISTGGAGPVINTTKLDNGNLVFTGSGGTARANYVVYATTNLVSGVW